MPPGPDDRLPRPLPSPASRGGGDPGTRPALDADLVAPSLLHELRQPLMGADASARLLERALGAALAGAEDWVTLRAQLDRIAEIMLEYEALLRVDGAPLPFAVGAVVARAVGLLVHRVRPLARRFALLRDDGGRLGWGAPGALVHAATNVVANALDAVEGLPGEPRVHVRVLAAVGEGVDVRVSDEGPGVPADLRARIFEPRFTTKPPGRGSGLGLHLARRLMLRQGGDVFLVEKGDPARLPWASTEFCILVPPPPPGGAP
jgi:signal transduction histidine kinase